MDAVGTTIVPHGMWIKTGKDEDGVSRSIYIKPQQEASEDVLQRIREAFEAMEPAKPVAAPEAVLEHLCTVYPIADAHLGLRAWSKETGTDYDTNIAAERVRSWVAQCVASSPCSETGIILDVGDFTHANDDTNHTPRSNHVLDVDTRMFRTLDVGIATLGGAVESALTRHRKVHVVILPGNHDSTIYMAVMFAIAERYRNEPRVIVHQKPGEFFIHEFGRVMIAAHHGDKAKADKAKCDGMKANAKDICMAEAKGKEKVAKAELDAKHAKDKVKAEQKVKEAKAEASYDLAKEKCDDQKGEAKDACVKQARVERDKAKGKAEHDKRHVIKDREGKREVERAEGFELVVRPRGT